MGLKDKFKTNIYNIHKPFYKYEILGPRKRRPLLWEVRNKVDTEQNYASVNSSDNLPTEKC